MTRKLVLMMGIVAMTWGCSSSSEPAEGSDGANGNGVGATSSSGAGGASSSSGGSSGGATSGSSGGAASSSGNTSSGGGSAAGRFETLPMGATLPSEADCATRVRKTAEVRPTNAAFNATKGNSPNDTYPRVTGNFTGTTDEIIQWAACKWGLDEDIVRAQMAKESYWDMKAIGDVASGQPSYGIGQVRQAYHASAFENDNAKKSTAYNIDYTYQAWRSCYDGKVNGASNGYSTWLTGYQPGDLWGCLGLWFSGRWHTPEAEGYISAVKDYQTQKVWTTGPFINYVSTL